MQWGQCWNYSVFKYNLFLGYQRLVPDFALKDFQRWPAREDANQTTSIIHIYGFMDACEIHTKISTTECLIDENFLALIWLIQSSFHICLHSYPPEVEHGTWKWHFFKIFRFHVKLGEGKLFYRTCIQSVQKYPLIEWSPNVTPRRLGTCGRTLGKGCFGGWSSLGVFEVQQTWEVPKHT